MLRTGEGVAADADAERLAETDLGRRVDSLVREGARTRDNTCAWGWTSRRSRKAS